jgi:Icc-related predicted phosphoesterase
MHIVAISDLHGILPEIPPCDLLLIAGDISPGTYPEQQARWLDHEFRAWLTKLTLSGVKEIVGIAGNHDFVFEEDVLRPFVSGLGWKYLQDSGTTCQGWSIWGSPWQPIFFDWAFNADDATRREVWSRVPDGTDILIAHGPPFGFGDGAPRGPGAVEHAGCKHLLACVERIKPRLVVFGHIHEGHGQWSCNDGHTILANVTIVDSENRQAYGPTEFNL